MTEIEFLGHVREQLILCDKDQLLVDVLEGLNLVVHLHENRLGRHFPVHAV